MFGARPSAEAMAGPVADRLFRIEVMLVPLPFRMLRCMLLGEVMV